MRLGELGQEWFEEIRNKHNSDPTVIPKNAGDFLSSFNKKVADYGPKTFISEGQHTWLSDIADLLGVEPFEARDFDD